MAAVTRGLEGARALRVRVRVARVRPEREEPDGLRVLAWHALVAASTALDTPGAAPASPARFHACLNSKATLVWTATRAGRVVGLAMLRLPAASGTGRAQVHVHPDHRRRGVGGRLVDTLITEARARDLHGVIVTVPADGSGDALCVKRGLVRLRTLHHLLLSLRDVHPGWLDEMAAVEHPGYRLTETAQIMPPGRDTLSGDVLLTVAAEHGRKVVGCTEVVVPAGGGTRATQFDQLPGDGHRLGLDLWVKAAMLRLLYGRYPQVTQVVTDNPEHDAELLDVNRHLGFRMHHRVHEYRLDLGAD
ncbi:GNAT family N-acetyltransferase [Actinomadura rupiterrae]|uniref:GNAT family N-acetyltransferase n=1 Tax=Actinomadura rupiterrae TaxID=559627 RepID=UPI0020A4CAE2|nr:GNAT family N-acetyltransferase [Actinomadura rupiterrae]MCP2339430.1 L-amino acid N-acyltransferase YncA [Actinomadura rupiterrae]